MPNAEDIAQQQELLSVHRKTLAHYLQQQAISGSAYIPPAIAYGIQEARQNIQRIKAVLCKWSVIIEDLPNDEEGQFNQINEDLSKTRQSSQEASSPNSSDQKIASNNTLIERARLLKAAATFKKLQDLERSLSFLNTAINYLPDSQLFLERGRLFAEMSNFREAFNDFSHAIEISDNEQMESESRLERLRVNAARVENWDAWDGDVKWLKSRAEGIILGEVLYFEVKYINDSESRLMSQQHEYALKTIEEAIKLGFACFDVYLIRAETHCGYCNYGLALSDINHHLNSNPVHSSYAIGLKGFILAKMNRFAELYDYYTEMSISYPDRDFMSQFDLTYDEFEEEVLCRYLIEYRFKKQYPRQSAAKTVLRFAKWHGIIIRKYPDLAPILHELLDGSVKIDANTRT